MFNVLSLQGHEHVWRVDYGIRASQGKFYLHVFSFFKYNWNTSLVKFLPAKVFKNKYVKIHILYQLWYYKIFQKVG